MKVNPIISQIIRGEWLLPVELLDHYLPTMIAILEGKDFKFNNEKAKSLLTYIDVRGNSLSTGSTNVPDGTIAIVDMRGEIVKNGDACVYGSDEIVKALNTAANNPNIICTIFKIDGPGGSVAAISPFIDFAKTKKKPVVVLADMALSLHYWTAVTVGDFIIAENDISARFGSVGVVLTFIDNTVALKKKGYKLHEIYPEESKHKNKIVQLIRKGDYDAVKSEHLSPIARKFQQSVRDNRPNLQEKTGVLTGKTFTAEEALKLGMIDKIGNLQTAIMKLVTLRTLQSV
jgi:protease-4